MKQGGGSEKMLYKQGQKMGRRWRTCVRDSSVTSLSQAAAYVGKELGSVFLDRTCYRLVGASVIDKFYCAWFSDTLPVYLLCKSKEGFLIKGSVYMLSSLYSLCREGQDKGNRKFFTLSPAHVQRSLLVLMLSSLFSSSWAS